MPVDYSLALANKAANLVNNILGGKMTVRCYAGEDGNQLITEFDGYPLEGTNRKGKVMFVIPRATFSFRGRKFNFRTIQQSECFIFQEQMGKPFMHPHVFGNGHPCWSGSQRERATDYICYMVETLTMVNVTDASINIGHRATGAMGNNEEAVRRAQAQFAKVKRELNPRSMINSRRQLERYVSNRWTNMLDRYARTA